MTAMFQKPVRTGTGTDEQPRVKKSPYTARLIAHHDSVSLCACYRLRYEYFVKNRRWVASTGQSCFTETDRYDEVAHHLAVFSGGEVIAYLRLLPWTEIGFMLSHEFKCLLPDNTELALPGSGEISRLVVADELCVSETTAALELLFKLFYQFAREQEFRHFFIVSEYSWLRACRHRFGLGFGILGPVRVFPDGTRTVAAYASLHDLERSMQEHSMEKFQWYTAPDLAPVDLA